MMNLLRLFVKNAPVNSILTKMANVFYPNYTPVPSCIFQIKSTSNGSVIPSTSFSTCVLMNLTYQVVGTPIYNAATQYWELYNVAPGNYKLSLSASAYNSAMLDVTIGAGSPYTLAAQYMSPSVATTLHVNATGGSGFPVISYASIDGQPYGWSFNGTGTASFTNVPLGTHTLLLKASGFYDYSTTIQVFGTESFSPSTIIMNPAD